MSKRTRLRPEPLHAPRATQQHAHPAPPKAPALMPTAAPAGRGLGTGPSPGSPLPVMLHDLCACPRQDWNVCHLGFGGQGSLEPFSSCWLSPWNSRCGEGRYARCLRNPTWLVSKAQRQEARNQDGRRRPGLPPLQRPPAGSAGQAQLPRTWRGVPCHLGGRCQSSSLLRTLVWSL